MPTIQQWAPVALSSGYALHSRDETTARNRQTVLRGKLAHHRADDLLKDDARSPLVDRTYGVDLFVELPAWNGPVVERDAPESICIAGSRQQCRPEAGERTWGCDVTCCVLQDDGHVRIGKHRLLESDDVRMLDASVDDELAFEDVRLLWKGVPADSSRCEEAELHTAAIQSPYHPVSLQILHSHRFPGRSVRLQHRDPI